MTQITLSTGDPSTLGTYRKMAAVVFGDDSKPVAYLDKKIAESPNGEDEEVIVAESQMVGLLGELEFGQPPLPEEETHD